ncbi:MAG: hypothetical protein WA395_04770 [Nitrososphaeraceae archaeon]
MTLNDVQNYARSTSKQWLTSWKEQTKVYLCFVANLFGNTQTFGTKNKE